MGKGQDTEGNGGHRTDQASEPGPLVRAVFHPPPPQFEGCFTTFYELHLEVPSNGLVEDYLQPEWANLRFFGGSCPVSQIGAQTLSGARFAVTGPSSVACHFEVGSSRMWGIGLLPLGWARLIDADAYDYANTLFDGARDTAFAKFDSLSELLCDPEAERDEQLGAIERAMDSFMRPSRDEDKIVRVHEALVHGDHLAVASLADACAMSVRTLERVCRRHFGFTPKRFDAAPTVHSQPDQFHASPRSLVDRGYGRRVPRPGAIHP